MNEVEPADRKAMPCAERLWLCFEAMAERAGEYRLSAVTWLYGRAKAPLSRGDRQLVNM